MQIPAASAFLVIGYVLCLVWALHGASRSSLLALAGLAAIAFALRIVYPHEYPWGFHEDEVIVVIGALREYCADRLVATLGNNLQSLLYAATIGPLYEPLGPWWAARSYSLLATVAAVPLAWGIGRALGLSPAAALAGIAAPFAAFPWALAYGRTSIGGEVILNELVVLFALIKCASARSWRLLAAALLLWFGLLLCCFGYTAGKVLLVTAVVATVVFPRRSWWQRVAVWGACALAALTYHSYSIGSYAWYGFDASVLPEHARPLAMVWSNWHDTLSFLWQPLPPSSSSQSLTSAAALQLPFVFLAGLGVLLGLRRRTTWILLIAFGLGLLPALLGPNGVSSRRLLTAVVFPPFFMGIAIHAVMPRWRRFAAGMVTVAVLLWGPTTYFSERFWTIRDKYTFCNWDCSLQPPGSPRGRPAQWGNKPPPTGCHDALR